MTNQQPHNIPANDTHGVELPSSEAGLVEAKHHLAKTFRRDELVWLLHERYDPATPAWSLDVLRQNQVGQWVRQRYRFDEQAEVLYFFGQSVLSEADARAARKKSTRFSATD